MVEDLWSWSFAATVGKLERGNSILEGAGYLVTSVLIGAEALVSFLLTIEIPIGWFSVVIDGDELSPPLDWSAVGSKVGVFDELVVAWATVPEALVPTGGWDSGAVCPSGSLAFRRVPLVDFRFLRC